MATRQTCLCPYGFQTGDEEQAETERELAELPPETDQEVNLANQFLLGAMGLTALVELPETLAILLAQEHRTSHNDYADLAGPGSSTVARRL